MIYQDRIWWYNRVERIEWDARVTRFKIGSRVSDGSCRKWLRYGPGHLSLLLVSHSHSANRRIVHDYINTTIEMQ